MKELPEPEGQLAWQTYTRDQVLAIQKQAYEDGLRDAGKDAERYWWLRDNPRKAIEEYRPEEAQKALQDAYNEGYEVGYLDGFKQRTKALNPSSENSR